VKIFFDFILFLIQEDLTELNRASFRELEAVQNQIFLKSVDFSNKLSKEHTLIKVILL